MDIMVNNKMPTFAIHPANVPTLINPLPKWFIICIEKNF